MLSLKMSLKLSQKLNKLRRLLTPKSCEHALRRKHIVAKTSVMTDIEAYSEPCQTPKMERFAKKLTVMMR